MRDLHVGLTTPYIIRGTSVEAWNDFFTRTVPRFGMDPPMAGYHELMKFGIIPDYWNEYIFLAYSGFQSDAVFLHGIPDQPESLPHFDREAATSIDLSRIKTNAERTAMRKTAPKKLQKR